MSQMIPRLQYSRTWEDPADFATHESSEIQNRRDIQSLFTELKTYNNEILLPALEQIVWSGGGASGESGGVSADPDRYLPLAGGTMRGPLFLVRNPQSANEAATRAYVDNGDRRAEQSAAALQTRMDDLDVRADDLETFLDNLDESLSDKISLEVSGTQTDGENVYARITLKTGPHESYGYILLDGNVDVSGQLSADALYASYGEIADLAVDRLSTSRRIVRCFQNDASDDNYIRIQNQQIEFVTGRCTGAKEQARNPAGEPLFWPIRVSGLSAGADGYPVNSQGERIFTVTSPTDWPVEVFVYEEAVKRSIRFEANADTGIYEPTDTYGAGNAQGWNYARIVKGTEAFDLRYFTPVGKEIGIRMGAEGYVDIRGTRKTSALDFSAWSAGRFTECVDGEQAVREYAVIFDSESRPVKITDSAGHETTIAW